MKTRLFTLLLCICTITTKAQYVTIPDTAFVAWLNNSYNQCMSGNQMNTLCPEILSETQIGIFNQNIIDLEGVQYFSNLKQLDLYQSYNVTYISALPATLETLSLSETSVISLPALPDGIKYLAAGFTPLTSLPTLPTSLTELRIQSTQISILPNLPDSLVTLIISNAPISSLPPLPNSLKTLNAQSCNLQSLPLLPNGLKTLFVNNNSIQSVASWPDSLQNLSVGSNQFTSIPQLPSTLNFLVCGNNNISVLPELPSGLQQLHCENTSISSLPHLPSVMSYLDCSNSNLSYITNLPDVITEDCDLKNNPNLVCLPRLGHIKYLYIKNTGINCLPNYGTILHCDTTLSTIPLCDIYNSNGCDILWNIAGKDYIDINNNCIIDNLDFGKENVKHKLLKNNSLIAETYSGVDGYFSFDMNDTGTYKILIDTSSLPFDLSCPIAGSYTETVTLIDSLFYDNNFALACKEGFDITTRSISSQQIFRPANSTTVNILAGDLANFYNAHCAVGVAGTVTVTINGAATYIAPANGALTPSNVSGNVVTWNVADFGTVNAMTSFNIVIQTDTFAQGGNSVCFTVHVSPTVGDNDSSNNTLTHCFTIVNSYDPNDKQVYPAARIDTAQEWLTYTVRFQNTGTAEAQHIYVMDTLDSNIDASTFQLLAYSHQPNIQIKEGIIRFNFPNINLPDSNTNEPASHGYVQYKVKLKEGLLLGTEISNTAYIYFDFNPPVITNTVTNTISEEADTVVTGIKEVVKSFAVSVYPNPANQQLTVVTDKEISTIQIYNTQGTLLNTISTDKNTHSLNIADLSGGIYYIEVKANGLAARKRFVKL